MNQTRKLLQKIVENARTGADACDQMLSCAKDVDLRNELMNERDVYQDFTRDAERALFDSGAQPHASSPMSRAGMWIGVKTNTLADDSAAHLAEIIIQGATMGVIAITRARNDLPDASPEAQDMAANMITVQQDAIERLKKHLVSEPVKEKQRG